MPSAHLDVVVVLQPVLHMLQELKDVQSVKAVGQQCVHALKFKATFLRYTVLDLLEGTHFHFLNYLSETRNGTKEHPFVCIGLCVSNHTAVMSTCGEVMAMCVCVCVLFHVHTVPAGYISVASRSVCVMN